MTLISSSSAAGKGSPVLDFGSTLSQLTGKGWIVVSEGESGAQLKQPKKMALLDKLCIGLGIPLLALFGVGIVLILIGVLDYAFFTKEKTHFLSRTSPQFPK